MSTNYKSLKQNQGKAFFKKQNHERWAFCQSKKENSYYLLHTAIHWQMMEDLQAQDLFDRSMSITELCQFISRMSSSEIKT